MAITVKHSKTSTIADAGDATLVQPSDWNADHTLTGTVPVANGGTGAATANDGLNALLPSQTANTGKVLTTDGTNASWATNGTGTVTSVATGTGLTGGPITTSGTISIDSTVATLTGTQTLTNKTITAPKIDLINDTNGNEILGLSPTTSATDYLVVKNGIGVGVPLHIYADGSSTNTGLHIQPKGTGLVTISDGLDFNKGIRFRSSSSAASAITLLDAVATAGRVVTLPDATTTLVGRDTTDTLTNKSISGTTNTLSNIGNAALTNSAITINGTSTSLGGSISVGTVTSVAATAGTGISISGSPITTSGTLTVTNTAPDQTVVLTGSGGTTVTGTYPSFTISSTAGGSGTVTSVAALTLGTTGTDLSSTVANGTTTPVITLNVPTASATNRGALSAADWTTFNNKGSGTVTSVTGTSPVVSSGGATPAISMAAANTTTNGYLTSTDWNTFNGKGSGTVTSASIVSANGFAGTVATSTTTPAITLTTSITGVLKGNATAISAATSGTDYSAGTSALATGILKSTTTTGALTIAVAADFPTLNQNTTGSAATFTSTSQNSQFNSVGVGTAGSTTAGEIRATNNVTAYYASDIKFKENVQEVSNALEIVSAIGSKTFDWNDDYIESHGGEDGYFVQKSDFGVIAQDVQAVFPLAVRTREDGTLAVDYEKLGTLAFSAIKELLKRVEALEAK